MSTYPIAVVGVGCRHQDVLREAGHGAARALALRRKRSVADGEMQRAAGASRHDGNDAGNDAGANAGGRALSAGCGQSAGPRLGRRPMLRRSSVVVRGSRAVSLASWTTLAGHSHTLSEPLSEMRCPRGPGALIGRQ